MATMVWMVDFVRTLRAQGEFCLVRGNIAAPQDCRSNVLVSYFGGADRPAISGRQGLKRKLLRPWRKLLQTSRDTEGVPLILLLGVKAQPNGEGTVSLKQWQSSLIWCLNSDIRFGEATNPGPDLLRIGFGNVSSMILHQNYINTVPCDIFGMSERRLTATGIFIHDSFEEVNWEFVSGHSQPQRPDCS